MDDNKLFERIKNSAENVDVPNSLQPEAVEKMAQETRQKKKKLPVYQLAASAAILLVALVAGWQIQRLDLNDKNEIKITAGTTEAAAEETTLEIAVNEDQADSDETTVAETQQHDVIASVRSEEELYQALKKSENSATARMENSVDLDGGATESADLAVAEEADSATGAASETSAAMEGDYSETNLQEAGVDEGDIVKTDGQFLYVLRNNVELCIIKADGGKLEEASVIQLEDKNITVKEMYLDGNRLYLIGSGSESAMEEDTADVYYINHKEYTRLYTYDITDRKKPKLTAQVEQDGSYRASRKTGEYVYLFTEYVPVVKETRESSTLVPSVGDEKILLDDIYLPGVINQTSYLVVSSVDVKNPAKVFDKKAIVSAAEMFYVSTENIYISVSEYNGSKNVTQILKFHYENGGITAKGVGEIDGYLNDSFSMNESMGYLRVVSTDWSSGENLNHLYVLDAEMKIVGTIKSLAPGETIRSARFFGNTGYFVTFRDVDPLFSVDLSDPENPQVLGELKITGFSSYLHFYGEDKLLGIGNEVDPETGVYEGIKLSMFDISDPSNVKEVDKYIIKDTYDMPGIYNYKAIMVNPDKNILGFVCDGNYMIFSYDKEKGFVNDFLYKIDAEDDWIYYENTRGSYIGTTFYMVTSNEVKAFDMEKQYELIGELDF